MDRDCNMVGYNCNDGIGVRYYYNYVRLDIK